MYVAVAATIILIALNTLDMNGGLAEWLVIAALLQIGAWLPVRKPNSPVDYETLHHDFD